MKKRRVIIVTDGDEVAKKAIEVAAANIGGRCISASAGNPTSLSGSEIIELIKKAEHEPVVVMVDDRNIPGKGKGERAMEIIINDDNLEVLGVVAVSSNAMECNDINLTCSITRDGTVIEGGVDKDGNGHESKIICGETLSILQNKRNLIIVGIGDPGKMNYNDGVTKGAPITTKALQEIISRSGII